MPNAIKVIEQKSYTTLDKCVACGGSNLVKFLDLAKQPLANNYHNGSGAGEEFELGSGVNHSINEVANMFGKDYPRDYIPKRKGEYDKTLCTDTNAHELLGWTPNKKLDEYIHDFVNNQK